MGKAIMARAPTSAFENVGRNTRPPEAALDVRAASRTVLGTVLARAWSIVADWLERGGRLSLYVGLLLVTFQAVRLPGDLGSIADPFLLISVLCAFLVAARGRAFNVAIFKIHGLGLLLVCAGVLASTVANATDDWQSVENLIKFGFTTTGTFFACVILLKHRAQLKTALGCWVISAAVASLAALLEPGLEDQSSLRLGGFAGGPNHLGAVAAMALAPGLSLAALSKGMTRGLWIAVVILCVVGVVISASRTAAIVAVVTIIPWLFFYYRSTKAKEFAVLAAGSCMLGAAVAIYIFVNVGGGLDVTARLASATDPYAEGGVASRLHQYAAVLRDASFLGTGLADEDAAVYGRAIHNMFLMLLHAGGLLSLLGIIIMVADLLRQGVACHMRSHSSEGKLLALCLTLAVGSLILTSLAEPVLYQRKAWVGAALLLALISSRRPHEHSRGRARQASKPHKRNKGYTV